LGDRRAVKNTRATEMKPRAERILKAITQAGKEEESETAWSSDRSVRK
jgi:hypothetical protein